ncbi:hypothetical protein [Clostridium estertheticum]|uniref:Uncharacterized protein n=2 Tax=Clostridium estertheticum TaxID=238834 RepID=A0A1J0GG41_9CLOT|nr:hypothetical protein [Clostridium estertheticum]APC40340.1 hypothetical protein A7L45_09820 [Clostridium estertheticum subsp. estertheticum]MBU3174280.1 hypothetical protein [Clostridium estertheticum]MBZ9617843.1 hypothetical protein [Clostridium estertheticum subsp. laramiense]MPQ31657.1 hypothetical protein [Clostridium estertheticum]MPQ62321.1 hypothetical protein [Clostridium estertheticum]
MSIILFIISFILTVILISLIVLDKKAKFNINSPITVYPFLTLFPIFLLAIPVLFIVSVFLFVSKDFLSIIFLIAIIVQILILSLYILFKINIITSKNLKGIGDAGIKQLRLTFSKKLLSYSIYSAILYSICIILLIIKCYSQMPEGLNLITVIYTMILTIIIAFLIPYFSIPVLALTIAVGIISVVIVIIMCLVVILSLNGTIRTIFLLPKVKEKWIFYILIMLVPLANVVYMFYLRKLINKELVYENNVASSI